MKKKAVFTICAKNYLAQALTLRESVLNKNSDVDFFLVLADKVTEEIADLDVSQLDVSWCPDWVSMAFKYHVIEFSTSVKPFFISKLFKDGYEKVMYLDPDIYVTSSLDYVWDELNSCSIMLTPHYNNIETNYTGAVTEEELLFVGIYNLGYCAIKNDSVGNKIAEWWCNRLHWKCYADHTDALHVDQRWIDFVPGFFPKETLISHHFGINVAIWNLHERELLVENDKYFVKDLATGEKFPLLCFHFSGFDPFNNKLINRRHPRFGVDSFPSFEKIIEEYRTLEYKNGYDKYSKLKYSFNKFSNGKSILPIHRRIYRTLLDEYKEIDPFDSSSSLYKKFEHAGMFIESDVDFSLAVPRSVGDRSGRKGMLIRKMAKVFCKIVGFKRYYLLLQFLPKFARYENQDFLLKR